MRTRAHSATFLDIVSFLGLAALLGVASGLVLGLIALVLATPAYAGEEAEGGEGALLLRGADGTQTLVAPLLSTDVLFRVSGPIARARLVQTFRNPSADWFEGVYAFPLPEGAAVDRLRLQVGERIVEGEIRERAAAKRIYDEARRGGRRGALLDQERPNLFTTSVANIGPHEAVVVELEYQETLRYDDGRFSLRFPMVIGPRYVPAGPLRVSDASRISPPVMRPGMEGERTNPVSIRVDLDAGFPIGELRSPYHRIDVRAPNAGRRLVALADGTTPANRDFELDWSAVASESPRATWFAEEKHGRHFGLLMVVPPASGSRLRLPREVTFVLDTSGSMAGTSIRQAKEALSLALARLATEDRFNVIEFNSYAQALFPSPRAAAPAEIRRALRWVEALEARGGTEMASALKLALRGDEAVSRVRQVVFLTDGAVGNEEQLFALIRERLGDARLFTVGIGSAPNTHFMTKAAQIGRGTFTYIGSVEEVRGRMEALFSKLETPVLKGLEVRWPETVHAEAWPARLPDLYAGEPVVIKVALDHLEGEAVVSGDRNGETWQARVALASPIAGAGLGSAWARAKVSALMDALREGAPEDTVRPRIVELATEHRLVTKYTSFVAVDRTPARTAAETLRRGDMPTLLPQGWEYDKVFGELPRGATDSRFALLSGLAALVLASMLFALRRRVA